MNGVFLQHGGVGFILDTKQRLVVIDDLAFLHQNFGNDAAFHVLDNFILSGRNGSAIAFDRFVNLGKAGP